VKDWGRISEVNPNNQESWRSRFFLTVDVDWAPDFVVEECYRFLAQFEIPSTWFVTHNTALLNDLNSAEVELGLHPNFSPLFSKSDSSLNGEDILRASLDLVPSATSFRNHSLVQSGPLLDLFKRYGFTHDCNLLLPHIAVDAIQPWLHWNGMIRVPHCWEDDVWVLGGCQDLNEIVKPGREGVTVLDIHPIHIYLNTNTWDTYKSVKEYMHDRLRMEEVRKKSNRRGVRTVIEEMFEKNL